MPFWAHSQQYCKTAPISLASVCVSVCPRVTQEPLKQFSWKLILMSFIEIHRLWLKSDNNSGHFTWRPACVSAWRCDFEPAWEISSQIPYLARTATWGISMMTTSLCQTGTRHPAHVKVIDPRHTLMAAFPEVKGRVLAKQTDHYASSERAFTNWKKNGGNNRNNTSACLCYGYILQLI